MVVATLVYVPSIASFRQNYLEERLLAAQIAVLALEEAPNGRISMDLEDSLLDASGIMAVIVRRQDKSLMLGFDAMPKAVDASFDLRQPSLKSLIFDAFGVLSAKGDRTIRVIATPQLAGLRYVEISMGETALYQDMLAYSNNILILAVIISILSGIIVYKTLDWMLVKPMRRVKKSIVAFRLHPEDMRHTIKPSRRRDEVGVVERELGRMQEELRHALNQRTHLAQLGEAVSKINHDLRNILSSAQLASEALERVKDPRVETISKRLERAISRAISLCERTLTHGRADEPAPIKGQLPLFTLTEDVMVSLRP